MKITSIKQQVKNAERASLFVDGKYSFSLSLNELVAEKLKLNQEINDSDLKRLKKLSEDGKLKARALEWVMNRPRSNREFRDYLYRKKAEPEQIDNLAQEFSDKKYLDEQNYAKWLIDMRRRGKKSDRAIKNELMKKGVSRETIAEVIEGFENNEIERLKEIVAKKGSLARYKKDPLKFKQYLLRQGFSYDNIKQVLLDT